MRRRKSALGSNAAKRPRWVFLQALSQLAAAPAAVAHVGVQIAVAVASLPLRISIISFTDPDVAQTLQLIDRTGSNVLAS